jgi:hypothetical protein
MPFCSCCPLNDEKAVTSEDEQITAATTTLVREADFMVLLRAGKRDVGAVMM